MSLLQFPNEEDEIEIGRAASQEDTLARPHSTGKSAFKYRIPRMDSVRDRCPDCCNDRVGIHQLVKQSFRDARVRIETEPGEGASDETLRLNTGFGDKSLVDAGNVSVRIQLHHCHGGVVEAGRFLLHLIDCLAAKSSGRFANGHDKTCSRAIGIVDSGEAEVDGERFGGGGCGRGGL